MEAKSGSEPAAGEQLRLALALSEGLPEEAVTPTASEGFVSSAARCLQDGKAALVLDALQDPRYTGLMRSAAWSLVAPLVEQLSREAAASGAHGAGEVGEAGEDGKACEACLSTVVQECSPREVMLGLLEALESSPQEASARTTLLLLPHTNTVVSRMRTGRAYSLGLFLSGAVSSMKALPLPHTVQQRCADAHALLRAHAALAEALRPHVARAARPPAGRDASPGGASTDAAAMAESEELRQELLRYCASVLEYPLLPAAMDALPDGMDEEFPLHDTAQALLGHMAVLGVSLSGLVMAGERPKRGAGHGVGAKLEEEEEEAQFSNAALCCLAHLLLVQCLHTFPAVYSPEFLLQRSFCYVSTMLQTNEEAVTLKGMALLEWALEQVAPRALGRALLELPVFLQLPQDLIKLMTLCPEECLRRRGFSLFQSYLERFVPAATHTLYRVLFKMSSHAGVAGFLIHGVKTQVDRALKGAADGYCFLGPSLVPLMHSALSLEHGAESDLLQGSDRVMAGLNLLRYLVIRDPPWENRTCVWSELSRLEERFLRPLRTGLSMSRAHYANELTRARSGDARKDAIADGAELSVSVGGDSLPSMPLKQRVQVLQSALFTFDLMESVMVRLEELIETEQKPPPCASGRSFEAPASPPLEAPSTP